MVDGVLDWLENTGMAHKLALLLLLAGLVSAVAFQFVVDPQRQRVMAFQHTLQSMDRRLVESDGQSDQAEILNDAMTGLRRRIESQKMLLGLHVPIDHILTDIVDTARSVGVTIKSWKPERSVPVPKTNVHQVTLRLHAEGQYHAMAHFLASLQALPKLLIVRSLDYRVRENGVEHREIGIHASFELIGFQAATSMRIGSSVTKRVAHA